MSLSQQMRQLAEQARDASRALARLDTQAKNMCLEAMASGIEDSAKEIQSANAKDIETGEKAGLTSAVLDRLRLTDQRIAGMAVGIREVAALDDPVGKLIDQWSRPNGIKIQKVRVPLGVILMIYESRPNVTADAACLCIKAGNAVILRGGSESIHSNLAIARAMSGPALEKGLPANSMIVVPTTDREAVNELFQLNELINLCIPRGGEGLIRAVAEKSRIPVIKHYKGVCHIYIDKDADIKMAIQLVVNAKCQRPGVCNAIETVLVDEAIADRVLPPLCKELQKQKVEIRADKAAMDVLERNSSEIKVNLATEEDWYAEYLDLILAIKVVKDVDEAIAHITQYGSAHSDCIVTVNEDTARKFQRDVDSSSVFWNVSTRFADGGQYGFGAEIGISTDKLHARGPMGLNELTSYKFVVTGTGQIRS